MRLQTRRTPERCARGLTGDDVSCTDSPEELRREGFAI
jgi:hypothetical protein